MLGHLSSSPSLFRQIQELFLHVEVNELRCNQRRVALEYSSMIQIEIALISSFSTLEFTNGKHSANLVVSMVQTVSFLQQPGQAGNTVLFLAMILARLICFVCTPKAVHSSNTALLVILFVQIRNSVTTI